MNFTYVECLLYTFHHLAQKVNGFSYLILYLICITSWNYMFLAIPSSTVQQAPNATNSLCGYKIVTGQPSDRLGEDFSDQYKDFSERWFPFPRAIRDLKLFNFYKRKDPDGRNHCSYAHHYNFCKYNERNSDSSHIFFVYAKFSCNTLKEQKKLSNATDWNVLKT